MSERFTVEATRERAHLTDPEREARGLPPAVRDILYLLNEIAKAPLKAGAAIRAGAHDPPRNG